MGKKTLSEDFIRRNGGHIVIDRIVSRALKGNRPGDPHERDIWLYLPPGYDAPRNARKKYPALMAVIGFTGSGPMLFNQDPLGEDFKHRMDRLILGGQCPPAIVVAPDCFTRFGGNQYINSSATGRYEDFLVKEVVPFINKHYRAGRWGVFGKSSGGYGSIVLGMRHPKVFQALADHSGDTNFELCYIPDCSDALDAFREAGGTKQWLDKFWADDNRRRGKYMKPLNALAMAAHYSPNPKAPLGLDFPFDLKTGVFLPKIWKRWQAWDPVNMVPRYLSNLRKLKLIYVDCGRKDEFTLHWGSRALVDAMRRRGLKVFYEEFDDGHMSISYRYDVSIPMLVKVLVK